MKIDRKQLRLYAVTDRSWLCGRELCEDIEKALTGGATLLQLREKDMAYEDFKLSALRALEVCKKFGVPLIINDNVEIAKEIGASGVHVGQDDMDISHARNILGENKIIGVTAKTVSQALSAQKCGADYLGSGAIFGSTTKDNAKKMDTATLCAITSSVKIPVVAIGGITGENILTLRGTGVAGAAVISGIFAQNDIEAAARDLFMKAGEII